MKSEKWNHLAKSLNIFPPSNDKKTSFQLNCRHKKDEEFQPNGFNASV